MNVVSFILFVAAALLIAWLLAKRSRRIDAHQRAERQRIRTRKTIADYDVRLIAYDAEIATLQGDVHVQDMSKIVSARSNFARLTKAAQASLDKITIPQNAQGEEYENLTAAMVSMPSILGADRAEGALDKAIKQLDTACRTARTTAKRFKDSKMSALRREIDEARAKGVLPDGTEAAYKSLEEQHSKILTAIEEKRYLTAYELLDSAERAGGNIEMRLEKEAKRKRIAPTEAARVITKKSAVSAPPPTATRSESNGGTSDTPNDLLMTGIVVGAILADTTPPQADQPYHGGGGESGGGGASGDYSPPTTSDYGGSTSSSSDSSSSDYGGSTNND